MIGVKDVKWHIMDIDLIYLLMIIIGGVREAVYDYILGHNYRSVFDWAEDNNISIDIDEWLNSDNTYKKIEVVREGYKLDILRNDKDETVRKYACKYL